MQQFHPLELLVSGLFVMGMKPEEIPGQSDGDETMSLPIKQDPFGALPDGRIADVFTLENRTGMVVRITNYGGIVLSCLVPDRRGVLGDVVLGYDDLAGYLRKSPYLGALVGRYANRIGGANFTLKGVEYPLAANNGENALHGGRIGFDKQLWQARVIEGTRSEPGSLVLSHRSPDGDEGYPGTVDVVVTCQLTEDQELRLTYQATTDRTTILNLTNHSYFNLAGGGTILDHQVALHADQFTPINDRLIPTGEIRHVAGTPFDFRSPHRIGARIEEADPQLAFGKGYDHNFVLNHPPGVLGLAAEVDELVSGRRLEVLTTEPGVQFYTGNFLDGSIIGKQGRTYLRRSGFCLETQHFPDSPHHPHFPSTVLEPGETYRSETIFRFSVSPTD
jgi:aldose 1-epimerase